MKKKRKNTYLERKNNMNIEGIKIDITGKSKEEIKKEVLDKIEKTLDEKLPDKEKENPLAELELKAKESANREGFNIEVVKLMGCADQIIQMLADAILTVGEGMELSLEDQALLVLQVSSMATEHIIDQIDDEE
nr:hypothetical protein XLIUZIGB_XLIUZIGB_CDS_0080 [Caudoviricetes sp.]